MDDPMYVNNLVHKTKSILDIFVANPSLTAEDEAMEAFAKLGEPKFYPHVRAASHATPRHATSRCLCRPLTDCACVCHCGWPFVPKQIVTQIVLRAPVSGDSRIELNQLADLLLTVRKAKPALLTLSQFMESVESGVTNAAVAGKAAAETSVVRVLERFLKVRRACVCVAVAVAVWVWLWLCSSLTCVIRWLCHPKTEGGCAQGLHPQRRDGTAGWRDKHGHRRWRRCRRRCGRQPSCSCSHRHPYRCPGCQGRGLG